MSVEPPAFCAAILKAEHKSTTGRTASSCAIVQPNGGTSAAAPAWAGVAALADQHAGHPLGLLNPTIYAIGRSSEYGQAFHDITSGSNTVTDNGTKVAGYSATKGWDPVTGWGTPNVSALVPLLAKGSSGS